MTDRRFLRNTLGFVLVAVAFFLTVALILLYWHCDDGEWQKNIAKGDWLLVLVAIIWTAGPPAWFIVENRLYGEDETATPYERFKYRQQLYAALWLGLMALLAASWTILVG